MAALERALREITHRLHLVYGTPHLGNWSDPTDELVYIVLSRKTAERAYAASYQRLKEIGSWDVVADMSFPALCGLVHGGGLETSKAKTIQAGLQKIRERFGRADLGLAGHLDDQDLLDFVASIPGVGPKSARCVLLYSFGRPVFPVDAHVGRVLARLGSFRLINIELAPMGHKQRQAVLADVVPPDLRYGLHVNLIAHGRARCQAREPECQQCGLIDMCEFGRGSGTGSVVVAAGSRRRRGRDAP